MRTASVTPSIALILVALYILVATFTAGAGLAVALGVSIAAGAVSDVATGAIYDAAKGKPPILESIGVDALVGSFGGPLGTSPSLRSIVDQLLEDAGKLRWAGRKSQFPWSTKSPEASKSLETYLVELGRSNEFNKLTKVEYDWHIPKVQQLRSTPEKKYAILDNDWGAVSFLPFPIALKNDVEALSLHQCPYHVLANLEVGNLSCIPVYAGATYPLINTAERFQAWETVHSKLPGEGAFALENATTEALGNDPTSGDPNRIVKSAFLEGFPTTKINYSSSAANFMVEMVRTYPQQVSIYPAGALTNVALAVQMILNLPAWLRDWSS
ncbi:hypothetical protein BBP40_010210 [Aspergillus hancockii]|nr:hypothetical protein BBP40_010210 [Aspergillus hancockii]